MGTSTFTHTDQFALECVRQPSRSPPLIQCSEETLKFMEMPLVNSTAMNLPSILVSLKTSCVRKKYTVMLNTISKKITLTCLM